MIAQAAKKAREATELDNQKPEKLDNWITSVDNQKSLGLDNQKSLGLDNQSQHLLQQRKDIESTYQSRKARKQKGVRLPVQKLNKWELWCKINKIDFQDAIEIAMDWITSEKNTGYLDNHILIDDIDDKVDDEILEFYKNWTGNKISSKDRIARNSVIRLSDSICKIGILVAIDRSKTKINSFAYCVQVIEQMNEELRAQNVKPEGYLEYLEFSLTSKRRQKK
jgi:hypothetical protein